MNIFLNLTGIVALVLLCFSLLRSLTYAFDGAEWTVVQYGLAVETVYLFFLGCLAEVTI